MREIKFRVWVESIRLMTDDSPTIIQAVIFKHPGYIPMLYIGLKDKNGKEIFEGDIVSVDDRKIGGKEIIIGEIYYCNDYTLESNPCFAGWSRRGHFQLSPEIEVIGNIYENPELMEK